MEAVERELRKAFEDVTTNNVRASIDFSNETRKIVRLVAERLAKIEIKLARQDETIEALKLQLANVQTKVYSGGT